MILSRFAQNEYLPAANLDSALSAYASIFLRKTARAALVLKSFEDF